MNFPSKSSNMKGDIVKSESMPDIYRAVTLRDLAIFKEEVFRFIESTLNRSNPTQFTDELLRSYEVKKMLRISNSTFNNYLHNGTLVPKRIGRVLLFEKAVIVSLLNKGQR